MRAFNDSVLRRFIKSYAESWSRCLEFTQAVLGGGSPPLEVADEVCEIRNPSPAALKQSCNVTWFQSARKKLTLPC